MISARGACCCSGVGVFVMRRRTWERGACWGACWDSCWGCWPRLVKERTRMARGMAESSARCASAGLVAGFTGFILVENGWGGKCETGRESGATRNTEGFERVRRRSRGVAGWAEKRRPEALRSSGQAGGTKRGLALGERLSGHNTGGFLHCDDLVGGDIGCVIDLAAGPADFDGVDFSAIAEAEGED